MLTAYLIIANIAIAVSAVGYGSEFFGVDLNATQTSQVTIVLLWFAAILNFRGNRFTVSAQQYYYLGLYCASITNWYNWLVLVCPDTYLAAWNPNDLPFLKQLKNLLL